MSFVTRCFLYCATGLTLVAASTQATDVQPVDPRGPIDNVGMTVVADAHGVQTKGYAFHNECKKPGPWQAKWIWLAGNEQPAVACLRKEIALDDAPKHVSVWLSADTQYRLFINGRLASRGPADIGKDYHPGSTERWLYDHRDLTPFFVKGKNVIAAEVFHHWPIGAVVSHGRGGFILEATAELPDGKTATIKTDDTWRGIVAPQWGKAGGMEYDAAREPAGWRLPGFADAAWKPCALAEDVWTPLVASEIPPRMEGRYPIKEIARVHGGVSIPEGAPQNGQPIKVTSDGGFSVAYNRVLSGYPTIKFKGGRGATITITAKWTVTVKTGDGEQCVDFPFMAEIVPAFTVEFKNVTSPIEIEDIGAYFTSQPVEYRGAFECSDAKLNDIWKVSRWAVQICLQTHHLDSPNHQEPISDPGDYLIESMVNHYAFAQPWLARQDIRKFAWLLKNENYHNFHTSYSIGWLQMLMDYYDYTGDKALVEEMAPYAHELLDMYTSWRGANGLISEAPNYMFMDWVNIAGFGCHHPPAVIGQGYLTAFYYHGLEMASRIAAMQGDNARVEKYAKLRKEIAEAFNRELWVEGKGLYRDGKPFQTHVKPYQWLPADKNIETFSPHVNLLAVLYDLAPKDKQSAIVDKVLEEKPLNTQPWFMHWVFQAIDHAGLFDKYATAQMRRWSINPETRSFQEMWNHGDWSHGWCSTPLVQMSQRVLGVRPLSPGFKTLAIAPQTCDLTWAKGSVPTPLGDVTVAWAFADGKLTLDVTVPPGSTADVTVPIGRFENPTITQDGQPCPATVQVPAGAHQFVVTGTLKPLAVAAAEPKRTGGWPQTSGDSCSDFESDVLTTDLIHPGPNCHLSRVEDHPSHTGGGKDAAALCNGTTKNGSGSDATVDDGNTFRGYGDGDSLTFYLDAAKNFKGYDISEIRVFAGHRDGRASQNYSVLVASVAAPDKFMPLGKASVACEGGSSETRLTAAAAGVAAVRFEFKRGSGQGGHGESFNVYREINIVGKPSGT